MIVELKNVSKKIKGTCVLDHINLKLETGNIYGLQGKNGSGKTMLMRAISGLIRTDGEIIVNGEALGGKISFPRSLGILIENPSFIASYTGLKNLEMLAAIKNEINKGEIMKALERVGLDPEDKRVYRKYSLGMKQRLGIAAAIMEHPEIIILDEPINALDESGAKLVRDILLEEKRRGALVILACHDKEELEFLSDKIFEIYEGKIINERVIEKSNDSN